MKSSPVPIQLGCEPQNNPEDCPLLAGSNVSLVSIQETFLPLIREALGDIYHLNVRRILFALGLKTEGISWNQAIWIPYHFGDFLRNVVYSETPEKIPTLKPLCPFPEEVLQHFTRQTKA